MATVAFVTRSGRLVSFAAKKNPGKAARRRRREVNYGQRMTELATRDARGRFKREDPRGYAKSRREIRASKKSYLKRSRSWYNPRRGPKRSARTGRFLRG
jgi:hypothetical protein